MMMDRNRSQPDLEDLKVMGIMLEDAMAWHYGLFLSDRAGVSDGTVYPALARLEADGWVESKWDESGSKGEDHPRRRLYKLTGLGQRIAVASDADAARSSFVKPGRLPSSPFRRKGLAR
jgi:hypothetical protein